MRTYLIYGDKVSDADVSSSSAFDPSLQNVKDRRLQKIARTEDTTLIIDRTKYDITYKSGNFFSDLGDKAIYDEFELKVKLVF
jgi:hypothetical protein